MTIKSTEITSVTESGGEAAFEGVGRVNGEDGFVFFGRVADNGEPGTADVFEIVVLSPGEVEEIYFAFPASIDNGNITIHGKT